jgi:hypothetical protein
MQTRLIPMSVLAVAMMTGKAPADSAIAEMICAPRAEILARLGQASVAGTGLRDTDAVLEVWTKASGDWTLVQSYANGTACILAMGEAWEAVLPPPA